MIDAVVFDLDGVIVDSEQVWDDVRRDYVRRCGGRWDDAATRDMMGMSSHEWSRYLHDRLGVPHEPERINADVVADVQARYRDRLPLLPGAVEAVERMAARWPLGLASSSNRPVIDVVLARSGLDRHFEVTVSSEEVPRGKPAPDVYLEVVRRLGVAPERAAAIEDSANGIRSASAAGLRVVAVPNPHFPPDDAALTLASTVVPVTANLDPETMTGL